jgi:uncharacterized protein (DUF924 family)
VSNPTPTQILDFWFGAPGSLEHGHARQLWFTKSAATDELISSRFGAAVEAALRGELQHWADGDARNALALILLLDQFTRNIYRDSARAFAGDPMALAVAKRLVADGRHLRLAPLERWFAYLPFEHSEQLSEQHESLRLFGELAKEGLAEPLVWAQKHYEVIARFGRYPHRNELLGRDSTLEEAEFLSQPGSRF